MLRLCKAILCVVWTLGGGAALAHHSMTVFELFATTIDGTVQDFRYINPHSILVIKASSGTVWHLEGDPPAMLARAGFGRDTFRRGDRLKLEVHRLRSGRPGGFWSIRMVLMRNGREFVGHECMNSPDRCEPP
jgi:Family of unknown function (DUF6152)